MKASSSSPSPGALWLFCADLHGRVGRYEALVRAIARERPSAVLLGGDLLPAAYTHLGPESFLGGFVRGALARLRDELGPAYPAVVAILGNDDARIEEDEMHTLEREGLLAYAHQRSTACEDWTIVGYGCVPPTPFQFKDWDVYDVSRFVDPGCVSPEEGFRTIPVDAHDVRHRTIAHDLERLVPPGPLDRTVMLFHAPPYGTALDRAALDGKTIDHVPLDVHVGSLAVRRFIEVRRPRVTLHGHIHESARLTGAWRERIGPTWAMSAAHDGPELALVRFDPARPEHATRELIASV